MAISFKPDPQNPWFRTFRITFGQYRGAMLKDLDDGYLSFVMDGSGKRSARETEAIELEWRWRGRRG